MKPESFLCRGQKEIDLIHRIPSIEGRDHSNAHCQILIGDKNGIAFILGQIDKITIFKRTQDFTAYSLSRNEVLVAPVFIFALAIGSISLWAPAASIATAATSACGYCSRARGLARAPFIRLSFGFRLFRLFRFKAIRIVRARRKSLIFVGYFLTITA